MNKLQLQQKLTEIRALLIHLDDVSTMIRNAIDKIDDDFIDDEFTDKEITEALERSRLK